MTTPTLKQGTLTLADHFTGTLHTYKAKFWLFISLALAPMAVLVAALVIVSLIVAAALAATGVDASGPSLGILLLGGLAFFAVLFGVMLFQYRCQAMTSLATRDLSAGYEPGWRDLMERTRGFSGRMALLLLALLAAAFAVYALLAAIIVVPLIQASVTGDDEAAVAVLGTMAFVMLLFLALGVVAVFLNVRWLYLIPAMGIEQVSGFDGLRSSWRLTRGAFWPTLGYYLLIGLAISIPSYVISMLLQVLLMPLTAASQTGNDVSAAAIVGAVVAGLLQFLLTVVLQPVTAIFITVMYLNRHRQLAGEPPSYAYGQGFGPGPGPQGYGPQGYGPQGYGPQGSGPAPQA
ncbi:glycerophosphoryl diester phosphodiesterase membrane domain-containing protein [Propioniciclava soli]|uniref:Glycerophosphoryl diester phosphodiesterase membrane domain-containing protein n=1 Tax=Propioniciclava soli TaxID=2775081 RepID=A0ABZ3C8Y7_9ACTN